MRTLVVETSAATMALCRNGPNVLSPYLFSIVSNVAGVSSKERKMKKKKKMMMMKKKTNKKMKMNKKMNKNKKS